ncbi:hypothetical protein BG000_007480 [Podila horticola]|nr:hypothetical protein BG000_007480 [Podila horticola]
MRFSVLAISLSAPMAAVRADCSRSDAPPDNGEVALYENENCSGNYLNIGALNSCQKWPEFDACSAITRVGVKCDIYKSYGVVMATSPPSIPQATADSVDISGTMSKVSAAATLETPPYACSHYRRGRLHWEDQRRTSPKDKISEDEPAYIMKVKCERIPKNERHFRHDNLE